MSPSGSTTTAPTGTSPVAAHSAASASARSIHSANSASLEPMRVHVADHPLITHKLTVLRDRDTKSPTFRALTEELVTLLAYEATRGVRVEEVTVMTPVGEAKGLAISQPRPLV